MVDGLERWFLLDMAIFAIYVVVSLELYFCKDFFLSS